MLNALSQGSDRDILIPLWNQWLSWKCRICDCRIHHIRSDCQKTHKSQQIGVIILARIKVNRDKIRPSTFEVIGEAILSWYFIQHIISVILLIKHTMSACHVPGTMLGTRNAMINEAQDLVGKTPVNTARQYVVPFTGVLVRVLQKTELIGYIAQ